MTFDHRERWEAHTKKECNRTTCKTCNKKCRNLRTLRLHESTHVPTISPRKCTTCGMAFRRMEHLENHQKNADPAECDVCNTTFCHMSQLERHKRTIHVGQGIDRTEDVVDSKQPVCPQTGYEEMAGYQEEMARHMSKIRDSRNEADTHIFLNKEITPTFT